MFIYIYKCVRVCITRYAEVIVCAVNSLQNSTSIQRSGYFPDVIHPCRFASCGGTVLQEVRIYRNRGEVGKIKTARSLKNVPGCFTLYGRRAYSVYHRSLIVGEIKAFQSSGNISVTYHKTRNKASAGVFPLPDAIRPALMLASSRSKTVAWKHELRVSYETDTCLPIVV